jgi:integrase/recombinase XerD
VWDRALILLLLGSGLRFGEVAGLSWKDVDGDEITVFGKGGKVRVIAPGKQAMAALRALPRDGAKLWDCGDWGLRYRLGKLGRATGLHVYPHRFRHTFADRFLQNGGAIDELATILGHARLDTTMIYLRARQQERALEAQRKWNPADALLGSPDGGMIPFRR